jgi:O-antigen/teichoic acid export membrane protein
VAARHLTPVGYGPFSVAVTIVLWLKILLRSVLLPGFRKAVSEDPSRLRAAVGLGWRWYAPLAAGALLLFVGAIPLLARLLGDPSLARLLIFAALDLPFSAALLFGHSVLNGLRQYGWFAVSLLAYSLGRTGGAIALLALGFGAGAALGGLALGSLVGGALALAGIASRLRAEPASDYPPLLSRSWMWTAAAVPSSFGWATLASLDLWTVQALSVDEGATGRYAAAFMVAQVPYLLLQGVSLALFPRLSEALASGRRELARGVTARALRLALLVLPGLCVVVAVSAAEVLSLLMSPEYAPAGPVLRLLFAATALGAAAELLLGVPAAADRPRVRTAVILSMLGLQAALLVVLVPTRGGVGAAWAMLGTMGAGAAAGVILTARYTGVLPPLGTALRVALSASLVFAAGSLWEAAGLEVAAKTATLGLLYLAVLVISREITSADLRELARAFSRRGGRRPAAPTARD